MRYKLIITEQADSHLDNIINYILTAFHNQQAATSILDDVAKAYSILEEMPEAMQFCNDPYLASKGYRKIKLDSHDYVLLYQIFDNHVYISGIFHVLENYCEKL